MSFTVAQIQDLARVEHQPTLLERLESGDLRAHGVAATLQRHQRELPIGAGGDLPCDEALVLVNRDDLRAWQRAALFVDELALDLGALRRTRSRR